MSYTPVRCTLAVLRRLLAEPAAPSSQPPHPWCTPERAMRPTAPPGAAAARLALPPAPATAHHGRQPSPRPCPCPWSAVHTHNCVGRPHHKLLLRRAVLCHGHTAMSALALANTQEALLAAAAAFATAAAAAAVACTCMASGTRGWLPQVVVHSAQRTLSKEAWHRRDGNGRTAHPLLRPHV